MYMELNNIQDKRRVFTLLTLIGAKTFNLLSNLCTPVKPRDKTYDELVTLMQEHVSPKPSVITERYKFGERKQEDKETIGQYIAMLKKLSINCEFGSNLQEYLRDRLVSGVKSMAIKKRLLGEKDLNYERAVEIALNIEATDREVLTWKNSSETCFYKEASKYTKQRRESKNVKFEKTRWSPIRREVEKCTCCGRTNHKVTNCKYKNYKCYNCGIVGHLKYLCNKVEKKKTEYGNKYLREEILFNINSRSDAPRTLKVKIEKEQIVMEIDTGTGVSVINENLYKELFSKKKLWPNDIVLKLYNGVKIVPLGKIEVEIEYKSRKCMLALYIIRNGGPPLLGRIGLDKLGMWIQEERLNSITTENVAISMKKKFQNVFQIGLGTYNKGKFTLQVKEGVKPKYFKPRPIPIAIKDKVEKELERLEKEGVIEQVEISEWGTPIVPIFKPDGKIRICGDYKVTINKDLIVEKHPLPTIEDLFAKLNGGQKFSKVDLSHAYQQVELEPESKPLVTISTHRGMYRYNRIPFGVASAPAKFQKLMEKSLQGLEGVMVFLDDILITGKNDVEHIKNLEAVLGRLERDGLRLKMEKCEFLKESVTYLGYKIDKKGLHALQEKVKAVWEAPEPKDVTQLRAFIGLANYYAKFIPHMATIMSPMYTLLQKNVRWNFNAKCKEAFKKIKKALISTEVLIHYDVNKPVKIECDASEYGLGAILSHVLENGEERPIAYASRTLSKSERKYSQIDKEGLALIFGIKKFNQYIYGRKFQIVTDHKPLLAIFGPKKGIPIVAANRLQRYAVFLAGYSYDIIFKKSKDNANADGLSRLPMCETEEEFRIEETHLNYIQEGIKPLDVEAIKKATNIDKILNKVKKFIMYGWPKDTTKEDEEVQAFARKKEQLEVDQGCILVGYKVAIPKSLRTLIFRELHRSHLGMVKTKSLARSYVWWPKMDQEIENKVRECKSCLAEQRNPNRSEVHSWNIPEGPWQRIHMDYAGPFKGKIFLIITDAYSKWIEIEEVRSTAADQTIKILRALCARYGIPKMIVSDNGPPYTSNDFRTFLTKNGIKQVLSPPYHPQTNGQAENSVKTFKHKLKCMLREDGDITRAIQQYLLDFRNATHSTTGESPAKLMMGRQLRSRLDQIRPDVRQHMREQQEKRKIGRKEETRTLKVGEQVMTRSYRNSDEKWIPATVQNILGPVTYEVRNEQNQVSKRHIDQVAVVKRAEQEETMIEQPQIEESNQGELQQNIEEAEDKAKEIGEKEQGEPQRRYPVRDRRKPNRLDL